MKSIKNIALSAMLTIGAFSAVTYTACTKDECEDVVCNNGGTCVSGNCSCPSGYEGTQCETQSRDKFIGTYSGTESCTTGTDNYTIILAPNSDAIKLTYTNLYNQNFTAICTMTGTNTFTFNGTQSGATFSGDGTLAGNSLTVVYTVADATTSNTCTFVGQR